MPMPGMKQVLHGKLAGLMCLPHLDAWMPSSLQTMPDVIRYAA